MSTPEQTQAPAQPSDKELNFRALEAKYERQLAQERQARQEAERLAQEAQKRTQVEDDDDDSEPYVDKRRLDKKLSKFGEQTKQQTQAEIRYAVQQAIVEERNNNWLRSNPDFEQVMNHADKIYDVNPQLAESILQMPDTFERQKLVYQNIKSLGLDKPPQKQPSIQDKVDANRKSPYYQPSQVGSAPYHSTSDFSKTGQEQAYQKMLELKSRLRLG